VPDSLEKSVNKGFPQIAKNMTKKNQFFIIYKWLVMKQFTLANVFTFSNYIVFVEILNIDTWL